MSSDPLDFLGQETGEKKSFSDPLSFLKPRSGLEKAGRKAAQYGIGVAEAAAFPYELAVTPGKIKALQEYPYRENLFEDIERLSLQKQAGDWDEKDEELLSSLIEQVKDPKKAEKFVQTGDIGIGSLAEKASKKLFDYDLEPEGFGENASRIVGNLISPSGFAKAGASLPSLGKRLVDKEFRHAIKEQKNWSRLSKAAEGNPERETLLKFARDHKLSPEATSLLYHSEGKAEYLSNFGRKTKKFKGAVEELRSKLGTNYEDLKILGKEGGYLDVGGAEKLSENLGKLLSELRDTHVEGADTSSAIGIIQKATEKVMNEPSTIKKLINSRINISQDIDWGRINQGNFFKKQARKMFADSISEQNPAIGKRLLDTDRAWSKYEQFKDVLDTKIPTYSFKGLKIPVNWVESAVFLGAPFVVPVIGLKASGAIAAKYGLQRLGTAMAVNPKFQIPWKIWKKSIMSGSTEGQKKAFLMIKNIAKKEDRELYDELKDIKTD